MDGYIKLNRKLLESKVFANETALKIWIWCLCKANHTKRFVSIGIGAGKTTVTVHAGQFIFGKRKASEELGISESTLYRWMQKFASPEYGMIVITASSNYSIISLIHWKEYQGNQENDENVDHQKPDITNSEPDDCNDVNLQSEPPVNHQWTTDEPPLNHHRTTTEPPPDHHITTNGPPLDTNKNDKNDKNEKNEKKEKDVVSVKTPQPIPISPEDQSKFFQTLKEQGLMQPKKKRTTENDGSCLFKNSSYFDREKLRATLSEEYQKFDFDHYFDAMADWSASRAQKRSDWPATLRNIMRMSRAEGKAVYVKEPDKKEIPKNKTVVVDYK